MVQILRLLAFIGAVCLGAAVLAARTPAARRRRIDVWIVYLVAGHFLVGVTQKDMWPFSTYRLMRGVWDAHALYSRIVVRGVDASGREWPTDPQSWAPLPPSTIHDWWTAAGPMLSAAERERAGAFLLARAESARRRRLEGRRVGNEILLGNLAAPDWLVAPPVPAPSPQPFRAIRIYREDWIPAEALRDPGRFRSFLEFDSGAGR